MVGQNTSNHSNARDSAAVNDVGMLYDTSLVPYSSAMVNRQGNRPGSGIDKKVTDIETTALMIFGLDFASGLTAGDGLWRVDCSSR
jgi:hypothetical protein